VDESTGAVGDEATAAEDPSASLQERRLDWMLDLVKRLPNPRQTAVLALMLACKTNEEIAAATGESTLHVRRAKEKACELMARRAKEQPDLWPDATP
jgi:DNA-directed RNA polymerase specialized sigma24 family protein